MSKVFPSTIEELVQRWSHLNDVRRGEALLRVRETASLRAIAKRLGCSEALLRHLSHAGRAPLADRNLANQGKINTKELVRRSIAAQKIARQKVQDSEAKKLCKSICQWLEAEGFPAVHSERIIDEARRELFYAECSGGIPKSAPKDVPLEDVILRSRPPKVEFDEISEIAWYAMWLVRWVCFAEPRSLMRDRALGMALNSEILGRPVVLQ